MGRTKVFRSPVDRGKIYSKLFILATLIVILLIPFDIVLLNGIDGKPQVIGIDSTLFLFIIDILILSIPLIILSLRIMKETRFYADDRIEVVKGSVRIVNHIPGSNRSWESEIGISEISSINIVKPENGMQRYTTLGDEGLSSVPGRSYEKFTHPYYHDGGLLEIRLKRNVRITRGDMFRPKPGYEKVRKPLSIHKEYTPVDLDRIVISIDPSMIDEFLAASGKRNTSVVII